VTDDWDYARYQTLDFETSGSKPEYALQPWRVKQGDAWATSLVSCRVEDGKKIFTGGLEPTTVMMRGILQDAIDHNRTIICWSAVFDIAWLIAYGCEDLVFKVKWMDGMLLWRHYFLEPEYEMTAPKKKSYSLKPFVAEYIPAEAAYAEDIDFHDTSREARKKLHRYNQKDNVFTLIGAKMFWDLLEPRQRRCAEIEAKSLPHVAKANLLGLPVDTLASRELQAKLVIDAAEALAKLSSHGVTEKVARSPKQLATLIFDVWGLPVFKENKSKLTGLTTRSTDKEVLHELALKDPRAKTLSEYREALNNKTKFADRLIQSVAYNRDGCVHPSAHVFGTYSGRLTYSSGQEGIGPGAREGTTKQVILPIGFAIHQMKGIRKKGDQLYRDQLIAPPGYALMEFDASGQEFRWMALASGDATMLTLCQPGEDAHSFMGAQLGHLEYRHVMAFKDTDTEMKRIRGGGKFANLSCLAEGSPVLTTRGYVAIEDVAVQDKVWDGVEWVSHDGCVFQGVKDVIEYAGIIATPDHKIIYRDGRTSIQDAKFFDRQPQRAWDQSQPGHRRAALRIVGGLVGHTVREMRRALCEGAVPMRSGAGGQSPVPGDREIDTVQRLSLQAGAREARAYNLASARAAARAAACQRHGQPLSKPEEPLISQLWRAWDRVSICIAEGRRGLHSVRTAVRVLRGAGHRPEGEQRALRAGQPYPADALRKPQKQKVFDLLNAGPRARFTVGSRLVSNCQYRVGDRRLRSIARVQHKIPMELPEASRTNFTYKNTYKGVPKYWDKQIALTKQLGYVETFAGRRVQVIGDWGGKLGWSMGSTSLNYRIQGTGADQKYLAIAVIGPYLTKIGAYFAWDLHDGIYIYVPLDKVQRAAIDIKYLLDNLPYKKAWDYVPSIPMPFDVKSGGSWGALKEYHY